MGAVRKPPSIAHLPHVHRAVYFKPPAEHNRALLEGAIRCLAQFRERAPSHYPLNLEDALTLIGHAKIALDEGKSE